VADHQGGQHQGRMIQSDLGYSIDSVSEIPEPLGFGSQAELVARPQNVRCSFQSRNSSARLASRFSARTRRHAALRAGAGQSKIVICRGQNLHSWETNFLRKLRPEHVIPTAGLDGAGRGGEIADQPRDTSVQCHKQTSQFMSRCVFPLNRGLIARGAGHVLVHKYHGH
jgi:hypothetical protein